MTVLRDKNLANISATDQYPIVKQLVDPERF